MTSPRQIVAGACYLISRRCTQRQFLLRPDKETNNAFVYCLALAALRTGVQIISAIANSNHHHTTLIDVEGRLPEFLEYFHKYVAKHQNALRGRWENFWSSEHTSVVRLGGPQDALAKTVYTLCNPVKDQLVEKAHQWPGATTLASTMNGSVMAATRPRHFFRPDGLMPEHVELRCVRAPGFTHLTNDEYRDLLADEIKQAEETAAEERRRTGRRILRRKAVLSQSPFAHPSSQEPRRNYKPQVATRDKSLRDKMLSELKAFQVAYAQARPAWLRGQRVEFPIGTWWLRKFAGVVCLPQLLAGP